MKVKVQFGSDIRRWNYPQTKRYQSLLQFIKQTFNFLDERQFYVQFEDDEGDHLTLTSETDFDDAFSCAEQEERKSLKIYVIKGSIEESHNNNNSFVLSSASSVVSNVQLNDEKEQLQHQSPKQSSQQSSQQPQSNLKNKEEDKQPIEKDEKPEEKSQESCQGNSNCSQWRQLVLDFLQNKEIQLLLPQFVRSVVAALRKEQQQPSNQKTVLQIIHEILGEDKFKPIINHELYKQKLVFMLPFVVEKLQFYQHVLLAFNEDAIASWVPNLINTLITSFSNFENIDVEIDIDPMYNQFCPLFSCMNDTNCENLPNDENKETIHANVTCDGCQRCPIVGTRYKCSVCNNYDLCSDCETSGKHDRKHPMLKITSPASATQRLGGLHEFLRWSRHRKSNHFPRGHHHWSQHCRRRSSEFFNNNANNTSNIVPEKKINGQFISDVTIPDKSYCPVDTVLTKTWRVRNNGDIEWGNDVELVFLKGDECLLLEKAYQVPNAKPGEEVDVSAVIKTPLSNGFYSTFFQLKKNGSFFGPQMWVELFAVEFANDDEPSSLQIPQSQPPQPQPSQPQPSQPQPSQPQPSNPTDEHAICLCGEILLGLVARQIYDGKPVVCNICNRSCAPGKVVYHCPRNQNENHPEGYDMCLNCVEIQRKAFDSNSNIQQNDNSKKNENVNENENVNKNDVVNKNENEDKNDDFVPIESINPVIVNENVNNNQNNNHSPKNSEPELIEMEDITDDENDKQNNKNQQKNEEDNFEFKTQLTTLKEMGFIDDVTMRFLLVKHKGDIQHVIQELMQA